MNLKKIILIILLLIMLYISILCPNSLAAVICSLGLYIYFGYILIYTALKWNNNKKNINSEYVKANIESFAFEIFLIITTSSNLINKYKNRAFDLWYKHNELSEINSFKEINSLKDFFNTYEETEKIMIYMAIGALIGLILFIIKKIICRSRISSDQILFSDGEIINIKDIQDINIEACEWTYSKKITITLEKKKRIIFINNKSFTKFEKLLALNNKLL